MIMIITVVMDVSIVSIRMGTVKVPPRDSHHRRNHKKEKCLSKNMTLMN